MVQKKCLELRPNIELCDAMGGPCKSVVDKKICEDIWSNFRDYSKYVENCGRFIKFPAKSFYVHGIPSPRQIIAWRELIELMGAENFTSLPFVLNYNKDGKIKFKKEFESRFGNSNNLKDIEVVFTCGYFWKSKPIRREIMLDFVVTGLLQKGIKVTIYTQDGTLKKDFKEVLKKYSADQAMRRKLKIKRLWYRIDIHYTLAKDNSEPKNSFCTIELPHTESFIFRLETYFPLEDLKTFCDVDKFMACLNSHLKLKLIRKRLLSLIGLAYNK